MSKIINKKQLDFLIESTMKEAGMTEGYYIPGGSDVDWTQQPENIPNWDTGAQALARTTYGTEKGDKPSNSNKPNNPNEPTEEDIRSATEYIQYMKDGMCECGAMMYEGKCNECGMNYMEEGDWMEEGKKPETEKEKEFAALAEPKDEITYADKIAGAKKNKGEKMEESDYVGESVKDLAESVTKTFNPSFLTEDMDNFKKLINYRNK